MLVKITQKRGHLQTSFVFQEDCLDYSFSGKGGRNLTQSVSTKRQVSWVSIPTMSAVRTATERDPLTRWLLYVPALLAIEIAWILPDPFWGFDVLLVLSAILISWLIIRLQPLWWIGYSVIPVPDNNNIIVIHDKKYEPIIAEIYRHRRRTLLAIATIDPRLTVRQNLRKFQWLLKEDIIDRESFEKLQRDLLPSVNDVLLKPAVSPHSAQLIEQKHFMNQYVFEFNTEFLKFTINPLLVGPKTTNIIYQDLPNLNNLVQFTLKDHLLIAPLCVLLAGMLTVDFLRDEKYYQYGWAGLENVAWHAGIPTLIAVLLLASVKRALVLRYTRIIAKTLFVIVDAQHDRILAELRQRRVAALKWYAEPDPLLTVEEQTRVLRRLVQEQVITQQEAKCSAAKAQAVQETLNLDDPVPAAPAAPASAMIH